MKKLMMLAAVVAVSFAAVTSQAKVIPADCTKGEKSTLFPKRSWASLKAEAPTAKPAVQKAVATKKAYKKGVQ